MLLPFSSQRRPYIIGMLSAVITMFISINFIEVKFYQFLLYADIFRIKYL